MSLKSFSMLAAFAAFGVLSAMPSAAEDAPLPEKSGPKKALATFGGGCFWCTEAVFEVTEGVSAAVSGYSGGRIPNPTYEAVCTGQTGHAEVIQVEYDPNVISYEKLLEIFFRTHDPTTLNRQGPDVGTQYRSVIFYQDNEQRTIAEEVITALNKSRAFSAPVVTQVAPLEAFFPAETYHQDYFAKNPNQGYCRAVVGPKVEKYRKAFADLIKSDGGSSK
jgi:peptide-methionine (S)-S-oxide reductase